MLRYAYGKRTATGSFHKHPKWFKPGGHFMSRFLRRRSGLKSARSANSIRISLSPTCANDLATYTFAAPLATDIIHKASAAGCIDAPASEQKAAELRSRAAPRGYPCASEGWGHELISVEELISALRRARHQTDTASRASRCLLHGAQRDLREPLTAMLRLHSDWDSRGTDMVAARLIEQQRQALNVMADLIDGFLTIGELGIVRRPGPITNVASQSTGERRREAGGSSTPRAEAQLAEGSMISILDRPERAAALEPASRVHRVLLVDEDREVLGALRIYLLCAGYRVYAAASTDEALDRARRARMATSPIDLVIANSDLTGDDDGLAVIGKTRLLLGYSVPAILLTTTASLDIGKRAPLVDVSLLRKPVNVYELNALISDVLKRPRRSRSSENARREARSRRAHAAPSD